MGLSAPRQGRRVGGLPRRQGRLRDRQPGGVLLGPVRHHHRGPRGPLPGPRHPGARPLQLAQGQEANIVWH